jgi:hypothetical protein
MIRYYALAVALAYPAGAAAMQFGAAILKYGLVALGV